MNFVNEFEVTGRIYSIRKKDENYVNLTLVVNNDRLEYPMILVKKDTVSDFHLRVYVTVKGYAIGLPNPSYPEKIIPRLYGISVKLAETYIQREFKELNAKGRFCEAKSLRLKIAGIIENILVEDEYYRYHVKTINPATEESVTVQLDWKKIDRHPDFKIGDEICAVCKINTPRKKIGTEDRIFLNLNVLDMEYIPN